jgi:hypothetical protein
MRFMFLVCLVLRVASHDRRMSLCMYGKVESMPLSDKEIYTFDYDLTSGVTLSFSSNR